MEPSAEYRRWMGWRIAWLLLLIPLLAACAEAPEEELSGKFGPGGAPPPADGPYSTIAITKASGTIVGYADYDNDYFTPTGAASSGEFENLVDNPVAATLAITLSRITGRPDTPCRFQAAILARDEGYQILQSGARENDRHLDFYQVNLKGGAIRLSLFCTTLWDEVGVAVRVIAPSAELIGSQQVHYLLNSIRKR
jgi:hypothetical protein